MSNAKSELVAPEPEHCPGTQSEDAGQASACQGCPNQKICASSTPAGPDPDIDYIAQKLQNVKHKILILSGKGGVGKSTLTAMLARAFAASNENLNIGVLDIDLCGPSAPRLFGVVNEQVHQSGSGWSPVYVEDNLALMSAGFLLPSEDSALIWRGPKKNGLIKQLLRDVDWDNLDYLLVDTPPGTSDEHLSIVQYLSGAGLDGCLIITTPQEVALLDVRKQVDFCRKVNLPILGFIENMSGFKCPSCAHQSIIWPALSGGAEKMANDMHVPLLGKIPLDPSIGKACDEGINPFLDETSEELRKNPAINVYSNIASSLKTSLSAMEIN